MLKKTLIAAAATAMIGGFAMTPSTAEAGTKVHIGFYTPGFGLHVGHRHGYYPHYGHRKYRRCFKKWRKVWTPYGPKWKKVRICRRYW